MDNRYFMPQVMGSGAAFLDVDRPQPVALFELAKGWLTGDTPELGELHRIET